MKNILALFLVLSTVFCLSACGKNKVNDSDVNNETVSFVSSDLKIDNINSEEKNENKEGITEKGKNKKEIENRYTYGYVSIKIPEGFHIAEENDTIAVICPDSYSGDTDNINFTKTNESIDLYTEDNINKTYSDLIAGYKGCKDYKKFKIDGYDAVSYNYTVRYNHTDDGVEFKQSQLVVFADSTVILSFTSGSGKYDDIFKDVIDSVKIVE